MTVEESEHVAAVEETARELAQRLLRASDAGVSPALLLPRLVLVFREIFGGDVPPQIIGMIGSVQ